MWTYLLCLKCKKRIRPMGQKGFLRDSHRCGKKRFLVWTRRPIKRYGTTPMEIPLRPESDCVKKYLCVGPNINGVTWVSGSHPPARIRPSRQRMQRSRLTSRDTNVKMTDEMPQSIGDKHGKKKTDRDRLLTVPILGCTCS